MSITFPVGTPDEGDTFVHENETYSYYHGKWVKEVTHSSGGGGNVDAISSNTSAIVVDSNDPTNPVLDITWGSGSDDVPRGNHAHSAYAANGHGHSQYSTTAYVDDIVSDLASETFVNNAISNADFPPPITVQNGNPSSPAVGDCWYNKSTNTLNIRIS